MPTATQPDPTTTRRHALGFSIAALAAGLLVPAPTHAPAAAGTSPDAELIGLCARLVAIEADLAAIMTTRHTLEDERCVQPAMDGLYDDQAQVLARLDKLPPVVTLAGTQALARAALAMAPRDTDGRMIYAGDCEWLAFSALEFIAGSGGSLSTTAPPTASWV